MNKVETPGTEPVKGLHLPTLPLFHIRKYPLARDYRPGARGGEMRQLQHPTSADGVISSSITITGGIVPPPRQLRVVWK